MSGIVLFVCLSVWPHPGRRPTCQCRKWTQTEEVPCIGRRCHRPTSTVRPSFTVSSFSLAKEEFSSNCHGLSSLLHVFVSSSRISECVVGLETSRLFSLSVRYIPTTLLFSPPVFSSRPEEFLCAREEMRVYLSNGLVDITSLIR